MESSPYADLAQLVKELTTPLVNKSSGTFFIATDDNASCRFAITNGEITHCCYKRFHGVEALQEIQAGLRGRGAFSENNPSLFRDSDKVDHIDALEHLGLEIPSESDIPHTQDAESLALEAPKYQKKTYRGQEIITEAPTNKSTQSAPKKPPRMYRGQILED